MTTHKQLVSAARCHRAVADVADASEASAAIGGSTTYLRIVALECATKALVLKQSKSASQAELARKNIRLHDRLFQGKLGHDLRELAKACELRRHVVENGKVLPDNAWNEIAGNPSAVPARPYSLRYGTEGISRADATAQSVHLNTLIDVTLSSVCSHDTFRKK